MRRRRKRPCPELVRTGPRCPVVLLALNDNAPPAHETTAIELEVYVGGGSVVDRAVIPYSKRWVKRSGPLRCHRLWERGCSD